MSKEKELRYAESSSGYDAHELSEQPDGTARLVYSALSEEVGYNLMPIHHEDYPSFEEGLAKNPYLKIKKEG